MIAILAGPLLAVQVQKWLEEGRERKRRQRFLFRELLVTRGTRLSPRHVEALNGVPIEFSANKRGDRDVLEAWRLYINHLGTSNANNEIWNENALRLLVDLIHTMGRRSRAAGKWKTSRVFHGGGAAVDHDVDRCLARVGPNEQPPHFCVFAFHLLVRHWRIRLVPGIYQPTEPKTGNPPILPG
ncbi:MAG TPA: DUF6680 family protein [Stellaceae bacterium]|nr:DUF6680 family protein [Stellaceae bacterium]